MGRSARPSNAAGEVSVREADRIRTTKAALTVCLPALYMLLPRLGFSRCGWSNHKQVSGPSALDSLIVDERVQDRSLFEAHLLVESDRVGAGFEIGFNAISIGQIESPV